MELIPLFNSYKDGFSASTFHEKCDKKGPTLTLYQNKLGYRFGGFTSVDWDKSKDKY